jgi:hypothetical protein
MRANGLRYPLVGETRQRHFAGTSFEPRKVLENAHAVLTDGSPTTPAPALSRRSTSTLCLAVLG